MSCMLLTMLVWDVKSTQLKSYLKKQKETSYLLCVADRVMAVASKEITENGKSMCLRTSKDFDTRTVLLSHSEDYGWGFDVYFKGQEISSFYLDYDDPTNHSWAEDAVLDFVANPEQITELTRCLNSGQEELIFEQSWNLFEQVLGINISEDYYFDALETLPEGMIICSGIEVISTKPKSPFKKLIKKHVEPFMTERGYLDSPGAMPYDYCYFKSVNGIDVGFMMDKDEKAINPYLKTIFWRVPLFPQKRFFQNEQELEHLLIETTAQFEKKVNEYQNELNFEMFDCEEIFTDLMHDYITDRRYEIVESSINQLIGGKILFRRLDKKYELEFHHSPCYLGLDAVYIEDGRMTLIYIRDDEGNYLNSIFKSQEEYIDLLEKYKHELNKLPFLFE